MNEMYGAKTYVLGTPPDQLEDVKNEVLSIEPEEFELQQPIPTIYILWDGDEPVYVGKTIRAPIIRVYAHLSDKKFDAFSSLEVDEDILDDLEMYMITTMKPRYNKQSLYTQLLIPLPMGENIK
ncbi:unnamed protein product [marine sediment metagenome]|uniref:GIY-YIG domain-containing protein n=1 Tax=marine sediment metagenome TaxID=412755 RepID=X1ASP3_9ZZZZ